MVMLNGMKKNDLNFSLNISLSKCFIKLNFRFFHKWPQLNAFLTVHTPSTTPCCNRLQNTEFKKMEVKTKQTLHVCPTFLSGDYFHSYRIYSLSQLLCLQF